MLVALNNSADILEDWFKFVHAMDPRPDKIVFCENNSTDKTLEKLKYCKIPYELIRFWTRPWKEVARISRYMTIAVVRQFLLTRVRYLDPDYALFIDDDIFVRSEDLIEALRIWNVDLVGGSYLRAFPFGMFIASLFKNPLKTTKYQFRKKRRHPLEEVEATSAGCMMLSRKLIRDKRVNFYPIYKEGTDPSEDFGYCFSARDVGYKVYLDGLSILTHRLRKKNRAWVKLKNGKFIWEK